MENEPDSGWFDFNFDGFEINFNWFEYNFDWFEFNLDWSSRDTSWFSESTNGVLGWMCEDKCDSPLCFQDSACAHYEPVFNPDLLFLLLTISISLALVMFLVTCVALCTDDEDDNKEDFEELLAFKQSIKSKIASYERLEPFFQAIGGVFYSLFGRIADHLSSVNIWLDAFTGLTFQEMLRYASNSFVHIFFIIYANIWMFPIWCFQGVASFMYTIFRLSKNEAPQDETTTDENILLNTKSVLVPLKDADGSGTAVASTAGASTADAGTADSTADAGAVEAANVTNAS